MSFVPTTNYFFEVSKGNVRGETGSIIEGYNPTPEGAGARSDLWGGGASSLVYPTAAETWEIVSDSVEDNASGTGAAGFVVVYLDINFVEQVVVGTLTGTTAVILNTDHYRPNLIAITSTGSGSTTKENAGTITVQVSGGGDPRGFIIPGFGLSKDGHFTVPAGKTAFIRNTTISFAKNDDGEIMVKVRDDGADSPWRTGVALCFYQSPFVVPTVISDPIAEKTDIRFTTTSTNSFPVSLFMELVLVDN